MNPQITTQTKRSTHTSNQPRPPHTTSSFVEIIDIPLSEPQLNALSRIPTQRSGNGSSTEVWRPHLRGGGCMACVDDCCEHPGGCCVVMWPSTPHSNQRSSWQGPSFGKIAKNDEAQGNLYREWTAELKHQFLILYCVNRVHNSKGKLRKKSMILVLFLSLDKKIPLVFVLHSHLLHSTKIKTSSSSYNT
jgi:hypothetical protein